MVGRLLSIVWREAVLALALILVGLTAGCGALAAPEFPTPRPSFTPSLEPSITPTRVFNASPTATRPQIALATSGPTPTPLIGVIPTHPLFTITPTLLNYAPGSLQIEYFTTNATSVKPGDKFTLYW